MRSSLLLTIFLAFFFLVTFFSGKYEQPYAEYAFTIDYQVIVQTSQGLRPSVPVGAQCDFVELFQACVVGEVEFRPTAQEVANQIRVSLSLFFSVPLILFYFSFI